MTIETAADAPMNIGQRIDRSYGELSPQEQRAADFILDHLSDLAIYSGTELAQRSGVSKATVSRLFRRLGFENAQEVREHARSLRSLGVPVGGSSPGASADLSAHLVREVENLRRCLDALGPQRLEQATELLVRSRSVTVVGLRNNFVLALHLREQLAQGRAGVHVAPQPGQTLAEEFAERDARDVAVVFAFRRRTSGFGRLVAGDRRAGGADRPDRRPLRPPLLGVRRGLDRVPHRQRLPAGQLRQRHERGERAGLERLGRAPPRLAHPHRRDHGLYDALGELEL